MKIKRFLAKEMRHGIRQVREALGPDAVILSNNRVNGGIEIVAAIDFDESLLQAESMTEDLLDNHVSPYSFDTDDVAISPLAANALSLGRKDLSKLDLLTSPSSVSAGEIPRTIPPAEEAPVTTRENHWSKIEWSQEPALLKMQNELHDLRGLLEQQLASLAWSELSQRSPLRAKLTRCLLELGMSPTLCQRVTEATTEHEDFDNTWCHALALLTHSLPVDGSDILDQGGIVALVGATGVGKTTTIAKLAARYALRHGCERIAMVTTDSYRIAAHEQLRTYGRILDIPVRIANNHQELVDALKLLSDRDLILIDTAGMSQRDVRLSEQFQLIEGSAPGIKTYLVLSTTTHRTGLKEVVKAFGEVKLDGCILTKLDETTSLGGALSTVIENKLPIIYVSDGQRVPEDIHIARSHSLITQAVKIAQETNQALQQESLNLAFSGMVANAHG
jgi:flagellar biosynthesis protein FlhF